MHSEETDGEPSSGNRFTLDDFRLRLDSPVFHRDPVAGAEPVRRELEWERPAADRTALPTMRTSSGADAGPADSTAHSARLGDTPVGARVTAMPAMPRLKTFAELVADHEDQRPVGAPESGHGDEQAVVTGHVDAQQPLAHNNGSVMEAIEPGASAAALSTASPWTFVPLDSAAPLSAHVSREVPILTPSSTDDRAVVAAIPDLTSLLARTDMPAEPPHDAPAQPDEVHPVADSAGAAQPVVVAEPQAAVVAPPVADRHSGEVPSLAPLHSLSTLATEPTAEAALQARSAAVLAELDRLAYVPEVSREEGAVEVPAIIVAEPAAAGVPAVADAGPPPEAAPMHTAQFPMGYAAAQMPHSGSMPMASVAASGEPMPTLSQHELYMPKAPAQAQTRFNYSDFAAQMTTSRRRKKHPVRKLLATIVLLAMVGGALFAAKYYFLDQRWAADVKQMAAEVETKRGLEFDHAVKVTSLDGAAYAEKLVKSSVGFAGADPARVMAGWRALGLLNGAPDMKSFGFAGIGDAPAFYDAGSETIYVVENLPVELRRFALQRALTMALLDQQYGWAERISGQSAAVQRGTRALYDADALAVATALLDPNERANVLVQQSALYTAYPSAGSSSPFATAVATRSGLSLRAYFEATPPARRDAIERDATITDAEVLDLRRLLAGAPTTPSSEAQGMMFWYHVLAARVGNDSAWQAALNWRDDSVAFVQGAKVCVTALVVVDPAAHDSVLRVFQDWAAAAPAESATQLGAPSPGQITVSACDPGQAVASNDGRARLTLGGAPLRTEQFRQLLAAFPQVPEVQLACAVFGTDAVSPADERSLVDTASGWTAPASHPAPDPNRAGCTA